MGACPRCHGAGKLRYDEDHLDENGEVMGHTWGTRACPCVRDLPAVEGEASWWETETALHRAWNDSIYPDSVVEITVDAEVPRDDHGRRVVMRGNRYYPTMVKLDLPTDLLMHTFQARDLAAQIVAAAEAAETIDRPCQDECGHWWPCECRKDAP